MVVKLAIVLVKLKLPNDGVFNLEVLLTGALYSSGTDSEVKVWQRMANLTKKRLPVKPE